MRVIGPLLSGYSARRGVSGLEVSEEYLVTGITAPTASRIVVALDAPGVPVYGQLYAGSSSIVVDDVSAEILDSDPSAARVRVTYRRATVDDSASPRDETEDGAEEDAGLLEVWTSTQEIETQVDADGRALKVSHTYLSGEREGQTVTQGASVMVQVPITGIRLTRTESRSPLSVAAQYVGRLNERDWNGYPERVVLCTGIDGRTSDGGLTYEVAYAFAISWQRWRVGIYYRDPETGEIPEDLVREAGIKEADLYPIASFTALNIDLSRSRRGPARSISFGALPEWFFPRPR